MFNTRDNRAFTVALLGQAPADKRAFNSAHMLKTTVPGKKGTRFLHSVGPRMLAHGLQISALGEWQQRKTNARTRLWTRAHHETPPQVELPRKIIPPSFVVFGATDCHKLAQTLQPRAPQSVKLSKSVKQECHIRASKRTQEKVSRKSVLEGCQAQALQKSILRDCCTRKPHSIATLTSSVKQ